MKNGQPAPGGALRRGGRGGRRHGALAAHLLRHDHLVAGIVRRALRPLQLEPRQVLRFRKGHGRLVQQREFTALLSRAPSPAKSTARTSSARRRRFRPWSSSYARRSTLAGVIKNVELRAARGARCRASSLARPTTGSTRLRFLPTGAEVVDITGARHKHAHEPSERGGLHRQRAHHQEALTGTTGSSRPNGR